MQESNVFYSDGIPRYPRMTSFWPRACGFPLTIASSPSHATDLAQPWVTRCATSRSGPPAVDTNSLLTQESGRFDALQRQKIEK